MQREITRELVRRLLPGRMAESNKGSYGSVLAAAGSMAYRGAAALCTEGALRGGAGLVYLASVEPVIQLVLSRTPECCACGCRTAANGGIHPQDADVEAAYNGDPAAESYGEVIFCYPAIKAISNYRIAHELLELGVPLIPRIITEMAHSETGIDIHPAAKIGSHFTIDHGTGVVIGATSIIGNNVKLYQGVTLGAKSFPLDADGKPIKGIPRHPILEDNVIVYSNATILGRITIGRDATVGGNIWVTENVPAGARIVQTKAKK